MPLADDGMVVARRYCHLLNVYVVLVLIDCNRHSFAAPRSGAIVTRPPSNRARSLISLEHPTVTLSAHFS